LGGRCFRDRKVTAPLKPAVVEATQRAATGFRDRKVTAPLKRVPPPRDQLVVEGRFRDRKVTAPLKPSNVHRLRLQRYRFP